MAGMEWGASLSQLRALLLALSLPMSTSLRVPNTRSRTGLQEFIGAQGLGLQGAQ